MMNRFLKTAIIITAILLSMTFVGEVFILALFPQYNFKGHLFIPLYFWLFYIVASFFVHRPMSAIEFTKQLIALKAIKMFLSMLFITTMAFIMREYVVSIVFNFIVYYLLLLFPECAYSIYVKKHIKREK